MRRTVGVSSTTRMLGALRTSGRMLIKPPGPCAGRGRLVPRRAGEKTLSVASGTVRSGADGITLGGDRLALIRAGLGDALAHCGLTSLGVGHARLGLIALGGMSAGAARAVHVVHSGIRA